MLEQLAASSQMTSFSCFLLLFGSLYGNLKRNAKPLPTRPSFDSTLYLPLVRGGHQQRFLYDAEPLRKHYELLTKPFKKPSPRAANSSAVLLSVFLMETRNCWASRAMQCCLRSHGDKRR